MSAIELCRTAALGGHVEACEDCAHSRVAYNSCRNRHCPKCQGATRERWLADRQADLLPVPYFHVVFTVPAEVAEIAFHNKAVVYAILFDAVAATLKTIAADPRHLGGEIGFLAILHTWGQALTHHPHIHCLVPGGALVDGDSWRACRPRFFLPVHVLSRLFRRLFLERLQAAHLGGGLRFSGALMRGSGNGRHTTISEHMPSSHRRYADWTAERLLDEAGRLGPSVTLLCEKILSDRPHPEHGYRSCLGILRLARHYDAARVDAAALARTRSRSSGRRAPRPATTVLWPCRAGGACRIAASLAGKSF